MNYFKKILTVLILAVFTSITFCQITPEKVDLYSNGNKLNADFYKASVVPRRKYITEK